MIIIIQMKRKTVLAGRKISNDLQPLGSKMTKKPSLFDHTSKIEQKLAKLKQEVQQKKRNTQRIKPSAQKISQKFKTIVIANHTSNKQLNEFLQNINLTNYEKILMQNGIDSLEILREIKQKQLQEIGVSKGHALKIMVSLRKMLESREKADRKQLQSAETSDNAHKITSKADKQVKNKPMKPNTKPQQSPKPPQNQPLQIIIQTDEGISTDQRLQKRRYFCLYCYQVCPQQFCGSDCQDLYNKMFEKYEKNLAKVQELFGNKLQNFSKKQEEQLNQDEFMTDLAFLDLQEGEQKFLNSGNFDQSIYNEALDFIKNAYDERRAQGIQQALQLGLQKNQHQQNQQN